jgi:hypothetical protein
MATFLIRGIATPSVGSSFRQRNQAGKSSHGLNTDLRLFLIRVQSVAEFLIRASSLPAVFELFVVPMI